MRILVIKTSSFGDIVHLFPALALLHRKYPDATVDFVVNPEFAPLIDYAPIPVNRKIIFERKKLGRIKTFFPQLQALIKEIRKEKYDFAVDFQGLFRNAFIAGIARADVKAGFAAPREKSAGIFYNRKIKVNSLHAVEKYGELATKLFALSGTPEPEIAPGKNLPDSGILSCLPGRYAVLLPGARWKSKRFPPELFREITGILNKRFPEMHFVAAGSAGEYDIAAKLGEKVVNLAGKTSVAELMEILRRAEMVIGNDSGPLHAAAALGVPVFGFYGASAVELTGPRGRKVHIFSSGAKCCGCRKRKCPDGSYRCMQLDAGAVADTIIKEMEEKI